jgi:hypothetical protein
MNEVRSFSFAVGADVCGVDVQAIVHFQQDRLKLDNGLKIIIGLPMTEALKDLQAFVVYTDSHICFDIKVRDNTCRQSSEE